MKKYQIRLSDGYVTSKEGEMLQVSDTGQTIIYSKNDPTYRNIVAIVPATALVIVTE